MSTQTTYPRVRGVTPLDDLRLRVTFDSGETKIYDCRRLLDSEVFRPLADAELFSQARPDPHGYGVIWSDEIDVAESELWLHGQSANEQGIASSERSEP